MLRYREEMGGFSHSEPEAFYPTLVVPESGCFAVTDTAVDTSGNACTGPVPDKPRGATSILVPWSFRGFPHPAPLGLARGSCDKVARLLGSLGYKTWKSRRSLQSEELPHKPIITKPRRTRCLSSRDQRPDPLDMPILRGTVAKPRDKAACGLGASASGEGGRLLILGEGPGPRTASLNLWNTLNLEAGRV